MSWSYDPTNLDTSTEEGRKNNVRLLIGDTNTNDQQRQDEEIKHALSINNDDVYNAAIWCARSIASSYARRVTTEIDGALRAEYSDLIGHYERIAADMRKPRRSSPVLLVLTLVELLRLRRNNFLRAVRVLSPLSILVSGTMTTLITGRNSHVF